MPVITLTSDIGHKDYLVGAVKGKLWQVNEAFQLADISHNITPFNYNEAAYFIGNACKHFPPFSWHIILVNMFDQPNPRCLLAFHNGMYFACPDNGLLPMVFDKAPETVIELPLTAEQQPNMLEWISVIANCIQRIENGEPFLALGSETEKLVEKTRLRPNFGPDWIEGRIIFIDRFENVVVNISQEEFESVRQNRSFSIVFKTDEKITKLSDHYGQVAEGDKLAFFNTAGYLEIAVNKGNAAGLFGLQSIDTKVSQQFMKSRMFYQSVRIFFQDQKT